MRGSSSAPASVSAYIAAEGELTSDLAVAASEQALERAGLNADDLDLIVVATTTPDHTFPACATAVQRKLGADRAAAFDVQAVCSGFVYALAVADNFIKAGQAGRVLVIGAETFSRLLDWSDRGTCVLFGDGAGAVVLQAEEGVPARLMIAAFLPPISAPMAAITTPSTSTAVPSSTGTTGHVRMNGREVFRHAVSSLVGATETVLKKTGLGAGDVDWLVPHQANARILQAVAQRLDLPTERILMTVDHHANTSAASIPLALAEADAAGCFARDQLVVMNAMGGGFSWGAALDSLVGHAGTFQAALVPTHDLHRLTEGADTVRFFL